MCRAAPNIHSAPAGAHWQPGPGPAAPPAASSSPVYPHTDTRTHGQVSVLLLRYCPACILAACPSCVPTPPPHPSQYQSPPAPGAGPSILAATGELIKNRNSWMNRIHETNKIRKDGRILDTDWSSWQWVANIKNSKRIIRHVIISSYPLYIRRC